MTIWDNIYKSYQQGGEGWASIAEDIQPLFKTFLDKSDFKLKKVLDIGCGTGKYLKLLQAGGFTTDGIDSSETAVAMTKKLLGGNPAIYCADMFGFEIPRDNYDLIISISTIHHGTKEQVQSLINKIQEAVIAGGKIYITLPDLESSKKWNTFKDHRDIAPGTFIPLSGPEQGLPHSFFTKTEVADLFAQFHNLKIDLDDHGRWAVQASK